VTTIGAKPASAAPTAPIGIEDATFGLYSATNASKGAQLNLAFYDGLSDPVQGRRPMSDYDGLVRDWLANGGEQIRNEYTEALANSAWYGSEFRNGG